MFGSFLAFTTVSSKSTKGPHDAHERALFGLFLLSAILRHAAFDLSRTTLTQKESWVEEKKPGKLFLTGFLIVKHL